MTIIRTPVGTSARSWCAPLLALIVLVGADLFVAPGLAAAQQLSPDDVRIRELLVQLEQVTSAGDRAGFLQLLSATADRTTAERFVDTEFRSGATKAVIQERERLRGNTLPPGSANTLTVDAFIEYGDRARIATWALEIRRESDLTWRIFDEMAVSGVENLYRLTLNREQQYDVKNFTVVAEDLELTLREGSVFTIETDRGITGMVLVGRGDMHFHPTPQAEIEQVRIFANADTLDSRFDAAHIRLGAFEAHADRNLLVPRAAVDPRDLRRAGHLQGRVSQVVRP